MRGVFVHCREALPKIAEGGGGAVVSLASISGVVGLGDQAAYSASKGAVVQLTRQLAVEWAPRRVRVNAVAPGAIARRFCATRLAGAPDIDEVLAQIARRTRSVGSPSRERSRRSSSSSPHRGRAS